MSYTLTGELIVKNDVQQVSEKFRKREFVIKKEENNGGQVFTDTINFQLTQDACDKLTPFNIGDQIEVSFNVRGVKWERDGKVSYFNNLTAWKLNKAQDTVNEDVFPAQEVNQDNDDLPF